MLACVRLAGNVELLSLVVRRRSHRGSTYIIVLVLWEERKPLLKENHHVLRHLIELGEIAVRVHVAEAGAHGLVNEQHVRKLVPRAIVVFQLTAMAHSVRSHFHHRAVHRRAAGPAVEPQYCPLSVGNVAVLVMPEEKIAVVLRFDFYVPSMHVSTPP
jgi:hypothetical protein